MHNQAHQARRARVQVQTALRLNGRQQRPTTKAGQQASTRPHVPPPPHTHPCHARVARATKKCLNAWSALYAPRSARGGWGRGCNVRSSSVCHACAVQGTSPSHAPKQPACCPRPRRGLLSPAHTAAWPLDVGAAQYSLRNGPVAQRARCSAHGQQRKSLLATLGNNNGMNEFTNRPCATVQAAACCLLNQRAAVQLLQPEQ